MLKLTNSFYRYLGLTCEKVNKTHVRRYSHLNLCTGRADINLTAQFHSSLQLLQPGHGKKRVKIKIPPLDLHKCKKPNAMSDHLHPSIMHTSYGGQFEVTASNFQNNQAWQKGATASSSQGSWTYNNIPPGFRAWEIIGDGRNNSHGPTIKFKVLSYNLLAQYLLDCHPYLYTECWPLDLNWNTRASRLFEEITNESPDILCLQEVQESHLDTFFSKFEQMGYNKVFKKKTGQREDGCAIYFKSSIFVMVSYITVEFNQPELPLLNRDNVGLMVKLVPYAMPDSPVVVATTHLLYNPKRPDVRLAQMQVFLAELDRFTFFKRGNETRFLPFILTGDFNSTPSSDVIKLLDKGSVDAGPHRDSSDWRRIGVTDNCQHLSVLVDRQQGRDTNFSKIKLHNTDILPDESAQGHSASSLSDQFNAMFNGREVRHSLKVASVYDTRNTATTFQNQWVTVDYIYYSTYSPLTLVGRLRLPSQEECEVLGRLPNHMYASDHLALAAAFELSYAPLHQEQASKTNFL